MLNNTTRPKETKYQQSRRFENSATGQGGSYRPPRSREFTGPQYFGPKADFKKQSGNRVDPKRISHEDHKIVKLIRQVYLQFVDIP